jgi:hypothetical protein
MQVHCRCGQPFTVPDARFPHHVGCHVCGHKFIVHEDAATASATVDSVNATCRCGKIYTVRYGPFPRDLHCLECNHKFSVLSTGEIIDRLDEAVTLPAASPVATTIPAASTHITVLPSLHAIMDAPTMELIAAASGLPNADRLERELKVIDLEWEAEKYQACVARVFGHMLMASPGVLIALGSFALIVLLLLALATIASLAARGPLVDLYLSQVGLVVTAGCLVYTIAKSHGLTRLAKAERMWRRKRRDAIAKFSPWAHLLPLSDADETRG